MDLRVENFTVNPQAPLMWMGCITFVPGGVGGAPILAAFGANPERAATDKSVDSVGLVAVDGGTACFEPDGGRQGSRPEVLSAVAHLAGERPCASVHWNGEGEVLLTFVHGRAFREIDLTDCDEELQWLPEPVRAAAAREFNADGDLIAFGLAVASAITGVTFDGAAVDPGVIDFLEIDPVPSESVDSLDSTPLYRSDRKLALRLDRLAPERQRELAEWVCLRLLELAELRDDPELSEVSAQFGGPTWPTMTSAARRRLGHIQRELAAEKRRWHLGSREPSSQLRKLWIAHWASTALVYCCQYEPATAAWRALYAAKIALKNAEILWPEGSLTSRFRNELNTRMS